MLLFLMVVVASLVLVELAVRLLIPQITEPHPRGFYTADAEIGFFPTPNQSYVQTTDEWNVQVTINAHGLRGAELGARKPDERRLLVLGDSFTFGHAVENDETYPKVIEQFFRSDSIPSISVINAGVDGYGTIQEAIWFERIVDEVAPDAVLLGFFTANDFFDNLQLNKYDIINGYLVMVSRHGTRLLLTQRLGIPPKIKIFLRTHCHLYTLAMNAWTKALVLAGFADNEQTLDIYREEPGPDLRKAIIVTRNALVRLKNACEKRQIPIGIVVIPDGRISIFNALDGKVGYRFERAGKIVQELADQEQIPFLDLTEAFENKSDYYYPVDGHWNTQGHAHAGRVIGRSLLTGKLRSLLFE